jgi:hypothetical protein
MSEREKGEISPKFPPNRRSFVKLAAGAAAAGAITAPLWAMPKKELPELAPGIKVSLQIPTDPSDGDLQFARQLGVEYVNIPTGGDPCSMELRLS